MKGVCKDIKLTCDLINFSFINIINIGAKIKYKHLCNICIVYLINNNAHFVMEIDSRVDVNNIL